MGANGLKVQIAVSMQRALHDPSRGIRLFSSETICHFLKKFNKKKKLKKSIALALRCAFTT